MLNSVLYFSEFGNCALTAVTHAAGNSGIKNKWYNSDLKMIFLFFSEINWNIGCVYSDAAIEPRAEPLVYKKEIFLPKGAVVGTSAWLLFWHFPQILYFYLKF